MAFALLFVDYHHNTQLRVVHARLNDIVYPFQRAAAFPQRFTAGFTDKLKTDTALLAENRALKEELTRVHAGQQKTDFLQSEVKELRQLLGARDQRKDQFVEADVIAQNQTPFIEQVIINRGQQAAVTVGQVIIDAKGVMGQVVKVSDDSSRVMLITDKQSAVPVECLRSGVRAIMIGDGRKGLRLLHVPVTADLQQDDVLVTSGLGERFLPGYPVGRVMSVTTADRRDFLTIDVEPIAHIDKSRYVLIVSPGGHHA